MKKNIKKIYDNLFPGLKNYISYNTFTNIYNFLGENVNESLKYYIVDKVVNDFKLDEDSFYQFSRLYDIIKDIRLTVNSDFVKYLLNKYSIIVLMVDKIGSNNKNFIDENDVDSITTNYLLKRLLISQYNLVFKSDSDLRYYTDEELILLYKNENSIDARNEIIMRNSKLINYVVNKFCKNNDDYDDLFQSGVEGFIFGLENFDILKGTKFSTYIVPYIEKNVRLESYVLYDYISTTYYFKNKLSMFCKVYYKNMESSIEELHKLTGFNENLIRTFLRYLNGPLYLDNDNGDEDYSVMDKISYSSFDFNRSFDNDLIRKMIVKDLFDGSGLTEKEKIVLYKYHGFYGDAETIGEIADDLGCSFENVRCVLKRGYDKLRKYYGKYSKEGYGNWAKIKL